MVWSCHSKEGIVDDAMPTQKAMELRDAFGIPKNDLKFYPRGLGRFKARHKTACHSLSGESSDVDAYGVGVSQAKLPTIIATYDLKDAFNFDETGLYYRAPPSKKLNVGRPRGMKKKKKDRSTSGVCTNVSWKE